MTPLFLDVEATDLAPKSRLVQLAYKDAATGKFVNEFFKPPITISFGAMAVHHITNEMVQGKAEFEESPVKAQLVELLKDRALVAHNADYDINILKNEGVEVKSWIDTLRVARHILESDRYGLQYLRYFLNLRVEGAAHDAAADVAVLEKLYGRLAEELEQTLALVDDAAIIEKMVELTNTPVLLKHLQFGKHKGSTFEEVAKKDNEYLAWLLQSETKKLKHDQDEDLVYTLKQFVPLTWQNS